MNKNKGKIYNNDAKLNHLDNLGSYYERKTILKSTLLQRWDTMLCRK